MGLTWFYETIWSTPVTKVEPLTEAQLKEIKDKNFIPDGYLEGYLAGKNWTTVDREGKPNVNTCNAYDNH